MKKKNKRILIFILCYIGLMIALFFVHKFAPLLLLLSTLIQMPLIYIIFKTSYTSSYTQRMRQREKEYIEDGDTDKWLKQENYETEQVTYRFLSDRGRSLNSLNRAYLFMQLKDFNKAKKTLENVNIKKLTANDKEKYNEIHQQIKNNT